MEFHVSLGEGRIQHSGPEQEQISVLGGVGLIPKLLRGLTMPQCHTFKIQGTEGHLGYEMCAVVLIFPGFSQPKNTESLVFCLNPGA